MNIVYLESFVIPSSHPLKRPSFEHNWIEYNHTKADELIERAKNADILIASKINFSREVMEQLPKLKLIAITATGLNNVDLVAAKELGICVKNVAGYSSVCVPEHTIGFIFALKHKLMAYYKDQLSDRWATCGQFYYADHPVEDIRDRTLGIVGKGNLGQETARLAKALGMKVIFAERKNATEIREGYHSFDYVLENADIISLHCPLTADTQNLINKETLSKMKKSAYLINTGRGPLVNEQDLVDALEQGIIAGAALDVLVQEPPQIDNPIMVAAKKLPNLIVTPHIAWTGEQALDILAPKITQNLEDFYQEYSKK